MTDKDLAVIRYLLDTLGKAVGELLPPDGARQLQQDWNNAERMRWDDLNGRWVLSADDK